MRIAVIDDEKYSRIALLHQLKGLLPQAELLEASSGAQAMALLERQSLDALFVDIHLGDMEGTTIAALARRLMPQARIIFATAYSQYAVRAFELQADDYLLKPIDPDRLREAVRRCAAPQEAPPPPAPAAAPLRRIAVSVNRATTLLDTDEIVYIETDGHGRGCILHTAGGKSYSDAATLGEYESKLGRQDFYRIHKTCIVQLGRVESIFPWTGGGFALRLRGTDLVLPISRERVRELRRRLNI